MPFVNLLAFCVLYRLGFLVFSYCYITPSLDWDSCEVRPLASAKFDKIPFWWYFSFMNGAFVAERLRESPPESLRLQPFPDAQNIGDYFTAQVASRELDVIDNNPAACAEVLTRYTFHRNPESLDLATALSHRYQQAQDFMSQHPGGKELLNQSLLDYFKLVEQNLRSGFVAMPTNTIASSDPTRPKPELTAGELYQRVFIPESIQRRSLAWNSWAQAKIQAGEVDELFTDSIHRHGAKLASGALLPAGNLLVEVAEGLARVRTPVHRNHRVEELWEIPTDNEWGSGLDYWFVMSHVAEKGILKLAESIGPDMIDGMKLTPEVYVRSYNPVVELIDLNPHLNILGILSDGSWIYSRELAEVFPSHHVSKLHDVAGKVIELGTAEELGLPIQAMFATYNPERRRAYEKGEYQATVAARFISRQAMVSILDQFGIKLAQVANMA